MKPKTADDLSTQILTCLHFWQVLAQDDSPTGKIFARRIDFGEQNNPVPGLVLYPSEEAMNIDAAITYDEFEDTLYMSLTTEYKFPNGESGCPLEYTVEALKGVPNSDAADKMFSDLQGFLQELKSLARQICEKIQTTH